MGKSTRGVQRERIDYSGLLSELQAKQKTQATDTPAEPEKTPPVSQPQMSVLRQRLMSNEKVKYFYARGQQVLHDKTCPEAKKISDSSLRWTDHYLGSFKPCPVCETKAYLRQGAKDIFRYAEYQKTFELLRITPKMQRKMYVHRGMKTESYGPGRLKIRGTEDNWILETVPRTSEIKLMHNNYRPLPDGTREFCPGYHKQVVCQNPEYALSLIAGYTYAGHKAAAEEKKRKIQAAKAALAAKQAAVPQEPPARPLSLWERIKRWIGNLFRGKEER